MYALKKILNENGANQLKIEIDRLIKKVKFDVYLFAIIPSKWKNVKIEQINYSCI